MCHCERHLTICDDESSCVISLNWSMELEMFFESFVHRLKADDQIYLPFFLLDNISIYRAHI